MSCGLDWNRLLDEAAVIHDPEGPDQLLAVLNKFNNPFICENDEECQALADAYEADLWPIRSFINSDGAISETGYELCVNRLAWLLRTLEAAREQKLESKTLVATLRLASAFSSGLSIWDRLPAGCLSDNFLTHLGGIIACIQSDMSARGQVEPIWERETVDLFHKADREEDWLTIEETWQTIVSAIWSDGDTNEAIACLCVSETGFQILAYALDRLSSVLSIATVAKGMEPEQIGRVLPLLKSKRARFVLVQHLCHEYRKRSFSEETLENLAILFRTVQEDAAEWQKWMAALNRYPVRATCVQVAFAFSLVNSTEEAKRTYIEAIEVSTGHGESRDAVTLCLSVFRQRASLEDRKQMWKLAFEFWKEWNFEGKTSAKSLSFLAVSELDYGLIGYGLECLSENDLAQMISTLLNQLNLAQNAWYSNRCEFDTAWYCALSRWQIFTCAAMVASNQRPWELPKFFPFPFDPERDRYFSMSLGTALPYPYHLQR